MTTNSTPTLLTERQAAEALGISHRSLQAWRCRGEGPKFLKLNGTIVRYRAEDLDAWVADAVRNSTSDPGAQAA